MRQVVPSMPNVPATKITSAGESIFGKTKVAAKAGKAGVQEKNEFLKILGESVGKAKPQKLSEKMSIFPNADIEEAQLEQLVGVQEGEATVDLPGIKTAQKKKNAIVGEQVNGKKGEVNLENEKVSELKKIITTENKKELSSINSENIEGMVAPKNKKGQIQNVDLKNAIVNNKEKIGKIDIGNLKNSDTELATLNLKNKDIQSANVELKNKDLQTAIFDQDPKIQEKMNSLKIQPKQMMDLQGKNLHSNEQSTQLSKEKNLEQAVEGLKNTSITPKRNNNETKRILNEFSKMAPQENIINFKKPIELMEEIKLAPKEKQVSAVSAASVTAAHIPAQVKNDVAMMNNVETPVFDLSATKFDNTQQLIGKISDYISQNTVANQDTVEMSVKHQDIGQFGILVSKDANNALSVQIQSQDAEVVKFFNSAKEGIIENLGQSGFKIADFKIDSTSLGKFTDKENSGFQQGSNQEGKFQGQDNQQRGDSQRRFKMWEKALDKEAA